MRRNTLSAARLLVGPTVALGGLALFAPGRLELGVRIYALLVGAAAIVLLLLVLRRAYPDETVLRDHAAHTPARATSPSLGRIEREVALGVASSFDLHYRLIPRLRSLAAGLLSSRRGVALATSPEAARALLGEEAWELVRPDRPAPQERLATGIPTRDLARVIDGLEAI